MLIPATVCELMDSSDVVGNIRFSHPTLYVFPGGQGDAALFGINGFNMLGKFNENSLYIFLQAILFHILNPRQYYFLMAVDGGFSRKSCFWDFVRHLDRLDAVLMTRVNNSNIQGIGSMIERKKASHVYPQIGHFFTNLPEPRANHAINDADKQTDPLSMSLFERGHQLTSNLLSINLKPQ